MMTRRQFIASTAATGAALALPVSAAAHGEDPVRPGPEPVDGLDPVLARVLALAALAPSSHNVQPWVVRVGGPANSRSQ